MGDLYPVVFTESEKLVTIDVQFTGPVAIAKGQFLEVLGEARGLVESSVDLTGNQHRISVLLALEKPRDLFVADVVAFSTPGSAEMVNVALVRKGGSGTPVKADGGAQKELLVYKESISSVDFAGMDYNRGAFGNTDRGAISLYGDPARRAKATVGADNSFSGSANKPGLNTPSGARITETNRSGLGGGSIFTMDGITFGLEVCLDQLNQKLVNYFATAAVAGDPKIQVQLIPSCGMSITAGSECTVPDGIIFNVDAYEYGCQKDGGGAPATYLGPSPLAPPTAATHFVTGGTAKTGSIEVYEEIDKPTPGVV